LLWAKENLKISQPKDGNMTVADYVKNNKGEIKSMVRFEVGEGIEKRSENFAEEVMNQINKAS